MSLPLWAGHPAKTTYDPKKDGLNVAISSPQQRWCVPAEGGREGGGERMVNTWIILTHAIRFHFGNLIPPGICLWKWAILLRYFKEISLSGIYTYTHIPIHINMISIRIHTAFIPADDRER